ncbi:MAG TPA: peptidase S51, partial [Blastocatellia bacterium]
MTKIFIAGLSSALILALIALGSFVEQKSTSAASQEAPEYGPAKGTLVIVGGGPTQGTGIMEKFIQLAGGPDAKFVIVPTAGGNKTPTGDIKVYKEEDVVAG